MKQLVQHLWRTNRAQIIERSRANCHCYGLHSIMLSEVPGHTIRMFFADWNHELHLNRLDNLNGLSVGFHPHHCDLTLAVVMGSIRNLRLFSQESFERSNPKGPLEKFIYDSKINGGTGGFARTGTGEQFHFEQNIFTAGQNCDMTARALHTVWAAKEERAAWFVFEGEEDPRYEPVCYSGKALEQELPNPELYQPCTDIMIARWLRLAGVL